MKLKETNSLYSILSLLLVFDSGNNTYSVCNCFNDIIDNFYVNFVL